MRIIVCAPYEEAFLLASQIQCALSEKNVQIDAFTGEDHLLGMLYKKRYDLACIALHGAKGYEAVRKVRDVNANIPIIWLTDDKQFGMAGYELHVSALFIKPYTREKFAVAVRKSVEGGEI